MKALQLGSTVWKFYSSCNLLFRQFFYSPVNCCQATMIFVGALVAVVVKTFQDLFFVNLIVLRLVGLAFEKCPTLLERFVTTTANNMSIRHIVYLYIQAMKIWLQQILSIQVFFRNDITWFFMVSFFCELWKIFNILANVLSNGHILPKNRK